MNTNGLIVILFCYALFTSCGIGIETRKTVNYPPLDPSKEVRILNVRDSVPPSAVEIGNVSVYDKGTTIKCDSATVFAAAKEEARKAGGNILKITEHKRPGFASSCHQIRGKIYRIDQLNDSLFSKSPSSLPMPKAPVRHDSRVALNIGWAWETAKIPDDLNDFEKDYLTELKSGSQYGLEYNYFINSQTGIGVMFNMFHSSHSAYATAQVPGGPVLNGNLSTDINIMYIAPNIVWRFESPTKMNAFLFGFSIGYLHYSDEIIFINSVTSKGGTVGFSYDMSYDLGLSKHTALGLGFSWKLGTLSSLDVTQNGTTNKLNLDDNNRQGIGHLDLSVGLRFR